MVKRCEVCGSEDISLRYSQRNIIFGDKFLCSFSCFCISYRFYFLIAGTLFGLLAIMFSYRSPPYGIMFSGGAIALLGLAVAGFSYERKLNAPSIEDPEDSITNRMKRLNQSLENIQNNPNRESINSDAKLTLGETDSQGFFNLSTGKIKSRK